MSADTFAIFIATQKRVVYLSGCKTLSNLREVHVCPGLGALA